MATVFTRHEVEDVDAWMEAYRLGSDVRTQGNVLGERVFVDADDPNVIIVEHDFASMDDARAMMSGPKLADALEHSGIVGNLTIWFANEI